MLIGTFQYENPEITYIMRIIFNPNPGWYKKYTNIFCTKYAKTKGGTDTIVILVKALLIPVKSKSTNYYLNLQFVSLSII